MASTLKTIALFGGTFNPVHFGHLRMALELKQVLGFDQMRLLPSHQPAHRAEPGVSAQARRDMLALALEHCTELQLDERELQRNGPTYTVDTLEELRAELGYQVSISFCMGLDSLLGLPAWHRWEQLLTLAHLVVVTRPGWQIPRDGEVAELLLRHRGELADLQREAAGRILLREQTLLPISATGIRSLIKSGRSPQFLLPERVLDYIQTHQLYKSEQ
ncbi:nicotinate-nucleotide adenylyltransferase [Microbulbifer bruguierae]|uniref:Probable nicotinate-nucleotide adenylyltransferase n=1 Tax=Microbulbifer bruguierae TaxID=3029061 RepID=A0ABY8NFF6_9GAMM|nr:nicotinate-nucleotide adenylyltransferase [Microbulbifer bruguierae]WGL16472.1 nicotinate-nucleotide adenylyltransferase [Microbulbifer bruguierae]